MSKKNKIIILVCIFVSCLAIGGFVGTTFFLDKDLEKSKKELQETLKKYGTLSKENVSVTVSKFNTQVMQNTNWRLLPVNNESMFTHEETYWFPLYEDISLVVVPVKFNDDMTKDKTKLMMLYFPKDSKVKEQALEYFKYLIFANNEKITSEEADKLISDAQELKKDKKNANNGKGIFVGISESNDYLEYQVVRSYK